MRRSFLLTLFIATTLSGCNKAPNYWVEARPGQKKILVSFPPLYSMTHAVAGDDGYVLCMLTTQGPHGYDGAATDIRKVNNADLFIFNGLDLDDLFVARMLRNQRNHSLLTLNVGEVLNEKHHHLLVHGEAVQHGDHKHGEQDPHIWLGPQQAMAMTKIIAAKLAEIDPAHKKGYDTRADKFIDELKDLEAKGKEAFAGKEVNIVSQHEAFKYFAKAFKLNIVDTIQKLPGIDPDAVTMAKLVKVCREKKVSLIAIEPQYSRAQAEALQANLKRAGIVIPIVTIDPLETAVVPEGKRFNPDPKYYLQKMKQNIDTLAKALP